MNGKSFAIEMKKSTNKIALPSLFSYGRTSNDHRPEKRNTGFEKAA